MLGKVSACVVAVAAGCDLVLALLSPIHSPGGAFGAVLGLFGDLLAIAIKVLAAWVLLVLTRPEAASVQDNEDPAEPEVVLDGSAGCPVIADEAEGPAHDDKVSWPVGVGAVWTRAGDAASGAEASSWDQNDAGGNWTTEAPGPSRDEPGGQE